jgi:hypothetical protein
MLQMDPKTALEMVLAEVVFSEAVTLGRHIRQRGARPTWRPRPRPTGWPNYAGTRAIAEARKRPGSHNHD